MGTQTMNSRIIGGGHRITRHKSWFTLTLAELRDELGDLGKPFGSTYLDELIKIVWTAESRHSSSYTAMQASLSLANAFSGKTVDEVWRDIQQESNKMRNLADMRSEGQGPTLLETTFEDLLVKAGMCIADVSLGPAMSLDSAINLNSHNFPPQIGLPSLSSPLIDVLSDTSTLEKRLRRKIKNRESAARSRARKEAYHNELESKVSFLEEQNAKLRKEKEFEQMISCSYSETRLDGIAVTNLRLYVENSTRYHEITQAAFRVFSHVPRKDLISWNTMLDAFRVNVLENQFSDLLRRMFVDGIKPNSVTILNMVQLYSSLSSIKNVKEAHRFLLRSHILLFDSEPTLRNALLAAYTKCRNMEYASKMFENLSRNKNAYSKPLGLIL